MGAGTRPRELRELVPDPTDIELLKTARHYAPHRFLGAHAATVDGEEGAIVRAFHPDATSAECVLSDKSAAGGTVRSMQSLGDGVFALFLPGENPPRSYRIRFVFPDGATLEREDPYRFLPTLGEMDLHFFNEGTHFRLWEVMGGRLRSVDGVPGASFAVWAPNAERVSVVGDFNNWDGRVHPLRSLGTSGVFELFVPGVEAGALYKYEIRTAASGLRLKTDPFALNVELPPQTAGRLYQSAHVWGDADWLKRRESYDVTRSPVSIYEVHLGSWARVAEQGDRFLSYREIAPRLIAHVKALACTHIEFMPLASHAYYASWGYQVTGYYAPTQRYGSPDDLRFLIDQCHQNGIGVIMDWVPAHFPKDEFSLNRFDGTALYEHEDKRRGEHPDWGTLIFNYARTEVRNFLVANALYWIKEFHIDGLRFDAVASMLYLDYSRQEGEWIPNQYGGRENLDAIEFLRATNASIRSEYPGVFTVAEESTAWGGVTRRLEDGGLGFTLKWNMGWMHDTLEYFKKEPLFRKYHQDQLTFAMVYEFTERFVNALSHDEVVHGKGSLIEKMPGDFWQRMANLRLLLSYQYTRPGKQLIFMGTELAQQSEWHHDTSLDWRLADHEPRRQFLDFVGALGALYREVPAFWHEDPEPSCFEWIDHSDHENSVLSYARRAGGEEAIVVLNFTPVPHRGYRIGVPRPGRYIELFNSDAARFGGSGLPTPRELETDPTPAHGRNDSLVLELPPLAALVLVGPSR